MSWHCEATGVMGCEEAAVMVTIFVATILLLYGYLLVDWYK